jgi:hypothetical protein
MNDFLFRLSCPHVSSHQSIDELHFLIKRHGRLLFLLVVVIIALLLLLLLFLLLFFLASILLYFLLEVQVNGDWIVFTEVSRNWDFQDAWVVFKIKE